MAEEEDWEEKVQQNPKEKQKQEEYVDLVSKIKTNSCLKIVDDSVSKKSLVQGSGSIEGKKNDEEIGETPILVDIGEVESHIGKTKGTRTPYKVDGLLLSLAIGFEMEPILSNLTWYQTQ